MNSVSVSAATNGLEWRRPACPQSAKAPRLVSPDDVMAVLDGEAPVLPVVGLRLAPWMATTGRGPSAMPPVEPEGACREGECGGPILR